MSGLLDGNGPGAGAASDRFTTVSLTILGAYLAATSLPLMLWSMAEAKWLPLGMNLAALGLVLALRESRSTRWSLLRDWIPLATGPLLYIELRWIIEGGGAPRYDTAIRGLEASLFPSDPSRTLALSWHSLPLSEVLHTCYLSYYALVYVPPALLSLRGHRPALVRTLLALVLVYCLCFVTYAIIPVDGPRYQFGAVAAPDGPMRDIVVQLLESGSSRGTAFPSSHVAASVVATIYALRFQRPLGVALVLATSGLALGAVYGGYHYAIDVAAGLVTGLFASWIAVRIEPLVERGLARDDRPLSGAR